MKKTFNKIISKRYNILNNITKKNYLTIISR